MCIRQECVQTASYRVCIQIECQQINSSSRFSSIRGIPQIFILRAIVAKMGARNLSNRRKFRNTHSRYFYRARLKEYYNCPPPVAGYPLDRLEIRTREHTPHGESEVTILYEIIVPANRKKSTLSLSLVSYERRSLEKKNRDGKAIVTIPRNRAIAAICVLAI